MSFPKVVHRKSLVFSEEGVSTDYYRYIRVLLLPWRYRCLGLQKMRGLGVRKLLSPNLKSLLSFL